MNVDGKEASQKCRVIIGRGFSRLRENHSITQTRGYLTGSKREGERERAWLFIGEATTTAPAPKIRIDHFLNQFRRFVLVNQMEREREREGPRLPSPTNPPIIINGSRT